MNQTVDAPAKATEKKHTQRHIRKVAILGSGVMGSRIACHFANIGCQVVLLDIVPFELSEKEKAAGLTKEHPGVRNRLVNDFLQSAIKSSPAPLYDKNFASRITTGNFDDDLKKIADCDLILEAVIERLDIKQNLYEKVEKYRKAGTIIASNTSGIPMQMLTKGRSDDFKQHFCGMHFFNPPRYLRLLEIIPAPETKPEIVDFLMHYGDLYLGKKTVLCKDTPAFIANRVGIFGIMTTLHTVEKLGLGVAEVDKLTGPVIGRPKSATFRTLDVVGLDTSIKVSNGLAENLPNDERHEVFKMPKIVAELEKRGWYGDKTKQGYYKKTVVDGKKEILELNLETFEYQTQSKPKFEVLEKTKSIDVLKKRFPVLLADKGKAGEFYRATFYDMFAYVTNRVPEIADELYKIDDAICAGFAWEVGPFETWDALGVKETLEKMKAEGFKPAAWVEEMLAAGCESFYTFKDGAKHFYDVASKSYKKIPGAESIILIDALRGNNKVWGNAGASLYDTGDGILLLEYHTKMNSMGQEVLEGLNTAISMAEKDYRGLVIGNEAQQFSAGANLAMLYMYALEQEFDEVEMMIRQFQNTIMRLRYSSIPVVAAPSGLALGGGCETLLHVDHIQAHAESYIGLVEVGVGLIPAGGGTKEMTMRVADACVNGDPMLNRLQDAFINIATAKVATSANEAKGLGYLKDTDKITLNRDRLLADAKEAAIRLSEAGYTQPAPREDVYVGGSTVMATFKAGAVGMMYGHYASEHDVKIAEKVAYVMSGGNLSSGAYVTEQYLLDLEREAFLSLCGERKTLERINSILTKGKPLRN
ncbi:MAG: 3-hydroxyacyl-CoA dehydrogenase/enoyl-CoA hydratase family protein [Bernardetiaceae bacterium]|nr:3-hydroxyacyl-CoA dehydrogenase/enoyl-CoA hydratase family protein [Bernardetiaceae bacterium]